MEIQKKNLSNKKHFPSQKKKKKMNFTCDLNDALTTNNFQNEENFEDLPLLKVKTTLSCLQTKKSLPLEECSSQSSPIIKPSTNYCYLWTKKFEKKIDKYLDDTLKKKERRLV